MTLEEHNSTSHTPDNCNETHQFQASEGYSRVLLRLKLNKFYKSLSYTAKNIIAVLIQSAPAMEKPFPIVISKLQHAAGGSKASVLRHIPKGEQAGLYERKNHDAGRKHGSIVTLNKELCERFLELHSQEYAQSANTNNESYSILFDGSRDQCGQALDLDNKTDLFFSSLSNTEKRVFTVISKLAEVAPSGKVHLIIKNLAEQTSCSEVTARRTVKRGNIRIIFDGRYKFARYFSPLKRNTPQTWEELLKLNDLELYDLKNDPQEMHNLAMNPEKNKGLIMRMNRKLNELIAEEVGKDSGPELKDFNNWAVTDLNH